MKWMNVLLKRKIIALFLVGMICIVGIFSVQKLDIAMMPDVDFDGAVLYGFAADTSVLDLEEQVINRLEKRIEGMNGIRSYQSKTSIGNFKVEIQFERNQGDDAYPELDLAVQQLKSELTQVDHIELFRYSMSSGYELYLDLYGEDKETITRFANEVLVPRLEGLSEVREVKLDGILEKEVVIQLIPDKIQEYGLAVHQIFQSIQEQNQALTLGQLEEDSVYVRWDSRLSAIEDLKAVQIPTMVGNVELTELADVFLQQKKRVRLPIKMVPISLS